MDWAWLDAQPAIDESAHIRHLHLAEPLTVRVDGLAGLGILERKTR